MAATSDAGFRTDAVTASNRMRRAMATGVRLHDAGFSYCLPQQPDFSHLRAWIKAVTLLGAVFGLLGAAVGGLIVLGWELRLLGENKAVLGTAACYAVGGLLIMFVPTFYEAAVVRSHLKTRARGTAAGQNRNDIHVSLEPPESYNKLKLLAEDVGLLSIYPHSRRIIVRGLSYEYLIRGEDLIELNLHKNGKSVLISYDAGGVQLDLAVVPRSLSAELRRQLTGSSSSVFENIAAALRIGAGGFEVIGSTESNRGDA